MTRKERKNQGIIKTNTGKYFQAYQKDGDTYMSPLFDSPEKVQAWFKQNKIKPDTRPHTYIWG